MQVVELHPNQSLPSAAEGTAVLPSTAEEDTCNVTEEADPPKASSNELDDELDDHLSSLLPTSSSNTAVELVDPTLLASLIDSVEFPAAMSFSSVPEILSSTEQQGPAPKRLKV